MRILEAIIELFSGLTLIAMIVVITLSILSSIVAALRAVSRGELSHSQIDRTLGNSKRPTQASPLLNLFRRQAHRSRTALFNKDKVKLLSPHNRLVIALHSPGGTVETGLRVCPPEKEARKLA